MYMVGMFKTMRIINTHSNIFTNISKIFKMLL